jgi:hypothetical protein
MPIDLMILALLVGAVLCVGLLAALLAVSILILRKP